MEPWQLQVALGELVLLLDRVALSQQSVSHDGLTQHQLRMLLLLCKQAPIKTCPGAVTRAPLMYT